MAADDGDLVCDLGEHGVVDLGGDMGFKGPHGVFAAGIAVLFLGKVFIAGLVPPFVWVGVVLEDLGVELPRDAADGFFIADIGGSEPPGGESAEELGGLDNRRGLSHAGRLDGGGDACGGAAVDDDIGSGGSEEGCEGEEESKSAHDVMKGVRDRRMAA